MGQQLFQTIVNAQQVTIAAVKCYCMGGGLDLALAYNIRIASANARFLLILEFAWKSLLAGVGTQRYQR